MKNIFISMTIAAILFVGCSGNKTKENIQNDGRHQHDDGLAHQNHEEDTVLKQEEFTEPVDTTSQKEAKHEHTHNGKDGHEHPHNH